MDVVVQVKPEISSKLPTKTPSWNICNSLISLFIVTARTCQLPSSISGPELVRSIRRSPPQLKLHLLPFGLIIQPGLLPDLQSLLVIIAVPCCNPSDLKRN